jgi:hypothetical protein
MPVLARIIPAHPVIGKGVSRGPGAWIARATLRPSSAVSSYFPLSIWKINTTSQTPSVGRAVSGAFFARVVLTPRSHQSHIQEEGA